MKWAHCCRRYSSIVPDLAVWCRLLRFFHNKTADALAHINERTETRSRSHFTVAPNQKKKSVFHHRACSALLLDYNIYYWRKMKSEKIKSICLHGGGWDVRAWRASVCVCELVKKWVYLLPRIYIYPPHITLTKLNKNIRIKWLTNRLQPMVCKRLYLSRRVP